MTAPFLASQLSILIQESKRKNVELRNAAEKSLEDIKSIPVTSEAQLSADLRRRPGFIRPFLIACGSHTGKSTSIGISCLQKLVAAHAVGKESIHEVLDAFVDAANQNAEIQLKILQALPPMLQHYAEDLKGESIGKALLICSELQGSKTGIIHSSAAATLQQLVVAIFDKVAVEDDRMPNGPIAGKIPTAGGEVRVRTAALDAYKILVDVCILADGQRPHFLRVRTITKTTGLELIEAVLTSHPGIFSAHPEQVEILRRYVMPLVIRSIAERSDFSTSIRAMRVFSAVLRRNLGDLPAECGETLDILTRLLDPDPVAPWRRALSMEVWRGIYSDFGLFKDLYSRFDQRNGTRDVVRDNLSKLARLAGERPDIIGLGNHSGIPVDSANARDQSGEQVALEAGGVGGMVAGAVTIRGAEPQGISVNLSSVRIACIDQLDKTEPPILPESYIYGLVLVCISNFSDGLAKFILPLALPSDRKSKRKAKKTPTNDDGSSSIGLDAPKTDNPGGPDSGSLPDDIQVPEDALTLDQQQLPAHSHNVVSMLEQCWPAALATCSTFLYATLDHTFFRALIRSFQKLTHVCGLVKLKTPRDAFLTTLSKAAVPPYLTSSCPPTPTTPATRSELSPMSAHSHPPAHGATKHPSASSEDLRDVSASQPTQPTLSIRNLLCLRALLNLGIALGPGLDQAWSIIVETWQQADFIVQVSIKPGMRLGTNSGQNADEHGSALQSTPAADVRTEILALDAAASRLLESTAELPNEVFVEALEAFCKLLNFVSVGPAESQLERPPSRTGPTLPLSSAESSTKTSKLASAQGLTTLQTHTALFCLQAVAALINVNMTRLIHHSPDMSGWKVLVEQLVFWTCSSHINTFIRLKSSGALNSLVKDASTAFIKDSDPTHRNSHASIIQPLLAVAKDLQYSEGEKSAQYRKVDVDIHKTALESLKVVLESCGETFHAEWVIVFDILESAFCPTGSALDGRANGTANALRRHKQQAEPKSSALMRPTFDATQLVCSDFLATLPSACVLRLVDMLSNFCIQDDDLNMSLTSISLFWNLSSFLQNKQDGDTAVSALFPVQSEDALRDHVVSGNSSGTDMVLWMVLLLQLTALAHDHRPDIRNGAAQSIFRILEDYGHKLTLDAWESCLNLVILNLIEANAEIQNTLRTTSDSAARQEAKAWDETTIIILQGVSGLFVSYHKLFFRHGALKPLWTAVVRFFEQFLLQERSALTIITYDAIRHILVSIESVEELEGIPLEPVWLLWFNGFPPKFSAHARAAPGDHDALLAYVRTFAEVYRLTKGTITAARIVQVLQSIRKCVVRSESAATSAGSKSMTTLQAEIFDIVKALRKDIPGVRTILIQWLAKAVVLPFERASINSSLVALAEHFLEYMRSIILECVREDYLYKDSAFCSALRSLACCISPTQLAGAQLEHGLLRNKAIHASLNILEAAIPAMKRLVLAKERVQNIWSEVVSIACTILRSDCDLDAQIINDSADQDADVTAFLSLRNIVYPDLGSATILDESRRLYCEALFTTSLIHKPERGEVIDLRGRILEGLYDVRLGKTSDPRPCRRLKMSYVCLDELFFLVTKHDCSAERVRLAQAAAPFLMLRAALPLRRYIADQPLRGRMPQPLSQRRELLHVLQKLMALECEPLAIPDAPGVNSENRKHLHRLFPLFSRAIRTAQRDQELLNNLCQAMDIVGDDMGVAA